MVRLERVTILSNNELRLTFHYQHTYSRKEGLINNYLILCVSWENLFELISISHLRVDLPYSVFAEIQLPQLLQLIEEVHLDDVVVGGVENFKILERCILEPV